MRRGELYVRVGLWLGGVPLGNLFSGYLETQRGLRWPPGNIEYPLQGPGLLRSVTGTNPAAGNEISETVPTNARWKLLGIAFQLVTDATAVTRYVSLTFDDGATVFTRVAPQYNHGASVTRNYSFSIGATPGPSWVADPIAAGLPDIPLFQGYRIKTSTVNLQAGDDFGAPQLFVEEWLEE